jgi:hypothetical protein
MKGMIGYGVKRKMIKMIKKVTDKDRINFLQKLTDQKKYTGDVILRISTTGRGWRLHETSQLGATSSVREAIDTFMEQ